MRSVVKWRRDSQLFSTFLGSDENRAFRECINPNAKRFEVKYKKISPAMLEDFTDRCLTLEELFMWRVPR
jgi:hypothetical protein